MDAISPTSQWTYCAKELTNRVKTQVFGLTLETVHTLLVETKDGIWQSRK